MDALQLSEFIKTKAREVGFSACGISKAEALEPEGERLDVWLKNERNADMQFMKNHLEKRKDPRVLVEGAKTVISVLANYYPKEELSNSKYKLAKYAYGVDYHFVVKEKLKHIQEVSKVHVILVLFLLDILQEIKLRKRLVGEGTRHDE